MSSFGGAAFGSCIIYIFPAVLFIYVAIGRRRRRSSATSDDDPDPSLSSDDMLGSATGSMSSVPPRGLVMTVTNDDHADKNMSVGSRGRCLKISFHWALAVLGVIAGGVGIAVTIKKYFLNDS